MLRQGVLDPGAEGARHRDHRAERARADPPRRGAARHLADRHRQAAGSAAGRGPGQRHPGSRRRREAAAEAKRIVIGCHFDASGSGVEGDADRLQQVIWNLLSNAIKFTPERGAVSCQLTREDSRAVVRIVDTGEGIGPEFLPHVFDRFRQGDSSITRRYGGLGIGLAIAKDLVEAHGGTISAESPGVGRGATFTVKLPLQT